MSRASVRHHLVDEHGWKPFAWSLGATLLVAGIHTGVIDALVLALYDLQHLS